MESTIAVMETHQSCSSNLVAKSVESPIRIDSISIDLINANDDIDTSKCEHFSIRGYASEMRNKDWKKCWPFALNGGQNISEEQNCKLPPLLVPKFRWWCCQNCLQESRAKGSENEERTVANSGGKLKSFDSSPHVSSHGEAATWLSDLQPDGKINVESRKHNANACVDVNSSDRHPLYSDKSEKKDEIASIPIIGKTDVFENNIVNKEIHVSKYASLMQQTHHIDDKVATLQFHKPDLKDNEIAGFKIPDSNLKCMVKDATETCQAGQHASAYDQQMELVKTCGSYGTASMVNGVPDAIKTRTSKHPSLELDDRDYASSESAGILAGTASGSLHRRKTRKVRLLTELLGKSGDEKTDLTSTEDSASSAIPDASTGIDSIVAPQDKVNFQGNVTSSLTHSRKRKLPQYEEWRPGEISSPNNGHKNLRTFNSSAETADRIATSDSEGTVNGSGSQTGAKSHLVNFKVDKSPIMGKKKNKKTHNFDEHLSLSLSGENLQKERQKKPGDATKSNAGDIVLYKSNDVSTGSGLDPSPECAQNSEKKSNLLKKKSKMHQDNDGQASPIPWNNAILREGLTSRKDVEIRQIGSVAVPLKVTRDAPAEKGMHFSLNNFLPAKIYDRKYITPIRDGLPSLFPWQGHVLNEYEIGRKDLKMKYVGDSSFPSNSELDAYHWKGMHVDLNSNRTTYRMPFLNEKQKHNSRAEVGSCSLIQQMDYSGTSNNGKIAEHQEPSTVARKHYDQQVEMQSEQGALDDIPMEIVELMAKNQYERCLPDTETDKPLPETTNKTIYHQRVDLNKVYGNEEMSLFHETTHKPKPRAKNGRIGKIIRGDNVGTSRQNSVDYFSHMDQNSYTLEQSYSPAGFRPFPLCVEKPLNAVQVSSTNSSRQNSSQNCQWFGNMVGQRSSHASMQALGVCNTCQSAPVQNKEAAHLWPSTIPNNMSYLYRIPQKCADQVANIDLLSHCPSNLPKGNMSGNYDRHFLNLASNFDKHSRKFDSDVIGRTHTEYPFACKHNGMGSLDLYANETIPAMHLLSLMDAGLQSGAPVDADGKQKFVKKASYLHGNHSKEFSSLPSGGYRINSMKHPLCDCYGKSHQPESFCECMSATPAVAPSTSTSSFQHDKSFKKAIDFTGQFSLKSREKEKKKCSDSQRQNRNHRSQKTVFSSSGLNTTCGSIPVHSMQKLVLGTSDFMMFPIQLHAIESATKQKQDARTMNGALFHPKSGSENKICCINRNPADFTVPEAGNMYMIGGEDLKFGREATSSGFVKLVGHKRQRKLTVKKKHSRNRTS